MRRVNERGITRAERRARPKNVVNGFIAAGFEISKTISVGPKYSSILFKNRCVVKM